MPSIFDNLSDDTRLAPALQRTFRDFDQVNIATGYLDLRGWGSIADQIDAVAAARTLTDEPVARVLVGMVVRSDADQIMRNLQDAVQRPQFGDDVHDIDKAHRVREQLVSHLRLQLSRGLATQTGQDALLTGSL